MVGLESFFAARADNAPLEAGEYIQDGIKYCGKCHTPKQTRISFNGTEYIMPSLCECAVKEQEETEKQQRQKKHREQVERLRKGITAQRYREMTFEQSDTELGFARKYVANWPQYRDENIGLMLIGSPGTGKTYAAACIANALVEQEIPVYMANMLSLTDQMARLFDDDRPSFIASLQKYSLLVIDDFGVERTTSFAQEHVYNIIETRYRSRKPLIITSNLSLKDMKTDSLDLMRTYDRLKEMCHPITMNGESRRREIANGRYRQLVAELGG